MLGPYEAKSNTRECAHPPSGTVLTPPCHPGPMAARAISSRALSKVANKASWNRTVTRHPSLLQHRAGDQEDHRQRIPRHSFSGIYNN